RKFIFCGTGILPVADVPQENLSFVEQASCLLLTMALHLRCNGCQEEVRKKSYPSRIDCWFWKLAIALATV
ncbi:MAG: hypothetical protein EAZ18_26560, partial [Oscillatoriales cyanobacterium]